MTPAPTERTRRRGEWDTKLLQLIVAAMMGLTAWSLNTVWENLDYRVSRVEAVVFPLHMGAP